MTDFADLVRYEEGWREYPYLCSEGYPTVGFGFKIGPKGAKIGNYNFKLPLAAGEAWLGEYTLEMMKEAAKVPHLRAAMDACVVADKSGDQPLSGPRLCVLLSMCYQMGVEGVSYFRQTLRFMEMASWSNAASEMLKSRWASQTPDRAKRHAEQMRTGEWFKGY